MNKNQNNSIIIYIFILMNDIRFRYYNNLDCIDFFNLNILLIILKIK